MPKEGQTIETKYTLPDARLIKYVKEKPLVQKKVDEMETRKLELEAKEAKLLSAKEEKEKNDMGSKLIKLKSKLGTFSNDKTEILDEIIFPSMANLQFFFEAVTTIPELSNFESDIRELFGIRRDKPRAYNYAFMFKELIMGMIAITEMNDEGNAGRIDFRLKLIHELQRLILSKIRIQKIVDGDKARFVILNDISRAMAWTEMFSSRVGDDYDLSKLSPRYDKRELDSCKNEAEQKKYIENIDKKTLEDFEKYTKKILLHRSFTYDLKKLIEIEDNEKYIDDMIAAIK